MSWRSRVNTAQAILVSLLAASVVAGCAGSDVARSTSDERRSIEGTSEGTSEQEPAGPATRAEMAGIPEGWQPGALRWSDCSLPRGGECATLGVPLDWQQPEGRQIELALGRIAAKGESIGSLVMNPGGPGGSGLELLSWDPTTEAVSDRFDLVSWDPRGVGRSTAVDCEIGVEEFQSIDPDPDDDSELAGLESGAAKIAGACGDDVELLAHVGTADVARDLEAIRRALGDEELNYLGFSYGTHIGQVYAAMYPTRIRAMVLDGVVDPALGYEEFLLGQAAAFEEVFDDNVRACAEAGPGRCGVDDLAAAYDEVLAAVESEPLPGGDRPVGPAELTTAALQTGYGEEGWRSLGKALAQALEGNGRALWRLADSYYQAGSYTSYAAVVCTDSPPPSGAEAYREFATRARKASPRFGGAVANELAPCATWPTEPTGTPRAIIAAGAPPILVIGNTDDPATPIENAEAVASTLESGVLVTVDTAGHTAYGSNQCATDLVDDYLIDLDVPTDGTVCG